MAMPSRCRQIPYSFQMKILSVNCTISDFGGVEFAAMNLARGLAARGHELHLLGARDAQPQLLPKGHAPMVSGPTADGLHVHLERFPRIYPMGGQHGALRKLIWHGQDLMHPANERIFGQALRAIAPDIVLLHNITAVGMNIWRSIARTGVPCIQVVHDLSLVCMNMSQFRGGRSCDGLCTPCKLYKSARFAMIDRDSRFAFVAPSRGILAAVERHVDLSPWPRAVIPNANTFLVRPRAVPPGPPRLLYVGRLDPAKGLGVLLEAATRARRHVAFTLDILGTGSLAEALQRDHAADWIRFHGSVPQDQVAQFIAEASLLMVPSLWPETVPGVAVHALHAGLPVMGSRIGGIPEHVFEDRTGFLMPPGDVTAWSDGIVAALKDPARLDAFGAESLRQAPRFDAELAVAGYESFMREQIARTAPARRARTG